MISFGKMSPYDNDWDINLYNDDFYFEGQYFIQNKNMNINKKSSNLQKTRDNLENQEILDYNYMI